MTLPFPWQCCRWIRVHEGGHGLLTARAADANLLRVVEGAVRLGTPLLLDEMPEGSLPPGLEGLLQPQHAGETRSGACSGRGLGNYRLAAGLVWVVQCRSTPCV